MVMLWIPQEDDWVLKSVLVKLMATTSYQVLRSRRKKLFDSPNAREARLTQQQRDFNLELILFQVNSYIRPMTLPVAPLPGANQVRIRAADL